MPRPHTWAIPCLLLAVGCDGLGTGLCDTSAAYSVTVSVFDGAGDPYAPDDVTYSVDGGPEASCDPISGGTEFLCGIEEVGRFEISVHDGGSVVAQQSVDVDIDATGCHVDSEFVEIHL